MLMSMPIFNMRCWMSKICEIWKWMKQRKVGHCLFLVPVSNTLIYDGSSPELELSDHKNLPISIFASSIQQSVCHLLSTVSPVWQILAAAAAALRRCSSHFEILPQSLFHLVLQTINRRSCTIMEKAPPRAFSWMKAAATTFVFKTLC